MRLSPTRVGLMLASVLSMNAIAQDGSEQAATDYEVIEAPALTSNKIKDSVLIEVASTGQHLVAVGAHGNIIYQQDNTWQQAAVPTSVLLTSVTFANNTVGYATGHHGVVIKTEDGGKSWQRVMDGFQLLELESAFFQQKVTDLEEELANNDDPNGDIAWDLDTAKFQLETVKQAQQESGPTKPFVDIAALDENKAIAVGAYNTIIMTTDGGASWQLLNDHLDNPDGFHLNSIARHDNQLFIAGEAGTAYRSLDGGDNWEAVPPPYPGSFFGAHFGSNGRLWLYGLRGNVFYSDDFGDSYVKVDANVDVNLSAGYEDDNGHQWLVGNSGTIVEIDPELQATEHRHPSSSVLTDIIHSGNEKVITGRSGLMFWPARVSKQQEAVPTAQGAQ